MKKLKFLLMLLLTMFLFDANSLTAKAAITDITGIPEYSMNLDNYSKFIKFLPGKVLLTEEDNRKLCKITIPEYSYVIFHTNCFVNDPAKISLYEDTDRKNKIVSGETIWIFLPKGDYYISIEPIEKTYCEQYLIYGRVSMDNLAKGKINKKKDYYTYNLDGYGQAYDLTAFMVDGFSKFYYDTEYTCNLDLTCIHDFSKEYYGKASYKFSVKNKKSTVSVKPSGETKKILNIESNGGNVKDDYDKFNSTKKDTKKPTVKGVKNNKTYKKAVKIKVSDKSGIKKVTLNGKKMKVSKFKKGYKITRKKSTKSYVLKVWDKAGNKRVVKFKIKKK